MELYLLSTMYIQTWCLKKHMGDCLEKDYTSPYFNLILTVAFVFVFNFLVSLLLLLHFILFLL
jgi:hypothetical protein